jgi:hypothetical protein
VPLAIGLPGNLDKLSHTEWVFRGNRQLIFALAHSPFVDEVPPATKPLSPDAVFQEPVTAEWLARQAAAGRIPKPDSDDPTIGLDATTSLVLAQEEGPAAHPGCPVLAGPLALGLENGDKMAFSGRIGVAATDGSHESVPRQFLSERGSVIRVLAGPVDVVVRPALSRQPRVCAPEGSQ